MQHPVFISIMALAIFSIGALAVRRVSSEQLVWWWFAWVAIAFAGLASSAGLHIGPLPVALLLSPLFCSFLLAGAWTKCDIPIPPWWLAATAGYCIIRSILGGFDAEWMAHVLTLGFEVPALVLSAFLLARIPTEDAGVPSTLFPYAIGLLVVARVADSLVDITGASPPPYDLWLASSIPLAVLQITDALDVSNLKARRASSALGENERRFEVIAQGADELILEADSEGIIVYASPSVLPVLGRAPEQLLGSHVRDLIHPDHMKRLAKFRHGGTVQEPLRMRHENMSWRWLEGTARSYTTRTGERRFVGVHRDVTERIDYEEKVRESQKLDSLGLLAGGIAHDFNNLLAPILGNAALALERIDGDSSLREILKDIEEGADRAADLTQQLLEYVGRKHREVTRVSLSAVVAEVLRLSESTLASNVGISAKLPDNLPMVLGDTNQIRQIVLNLLTNATDAIGESGGTVSVYTDLIDADVTYLAQTELGGDLWPGKFGYLEVRDDGAGMEPEERARIFDPFYTTKSGRRGLGLAVLLGIVRSHAGAVEVKTTAGLGTSIRVLLPLAPSDAASRAEPVEDLTVHIPRGTVLIADDEPLVRNLAARILEHAGYRCLLAADGQAALVTLKAHADEIVAVLLDITMPELRGDQAFRKIRERHPTLPVVFSSGYPAESLVDRLPDDDAVEFVEKPYRPGQLTEAVGRLVGEG